MVEHGHPKQEITAENPLLNTVELGDSWGLELLVFTWERAPSELRKSDQRLLGLVPLHQNMVAYMVAGVSLAVAVLRDKIVQSSGIPSRGIATFQ